MDITKVHTVYFLGIGGIGMSALARYFLAQNCQVLGYDKTKTELTDLLEKEGAKVHYEEQVEVVAELMNSDEQVLFCYTPAIPKNNKELAFLIENNIPLSKRSEVLGFITAKYFTIAIAGTHGKTTTSSMVAHILNDAGIDCIAFLGGISLNFNSNLLLNSKARIAVVEADEYDRSFLTLSPDIALITSLDADHLDIYTNNDQMQEAYTAFVDKIKKQGTLIVNRPYLEAVSGRNDIVLRSYALSGGADTYASSLHVEGGAYHTDIITKSNKVKDVELGLPGVHNVENAIGAFAIAWEMGIPGDQIKNALKTYKGVKRRFETHVKSKDVVYIDDYAHHPSELNACIASLRELYPSKKITGVFQPHLYSRTRDFMDEFAQSLSQLDELILLDIYPAREEPIPGITSQALLDKITIKNKINTSKEETLDELMNKNIEILVTMGAGDIDTLVQPIKAYLEATHE